RDAAFDEHPDKRFFKLSFEDISVHVLMEILDLPDAQQRRFEEAYEACKVVMERTGIFPATPDEQQQALEIDELDAGWPKMTIDMMLDIVTAAIRVCNKYEEFNGLARGFRGREANVFTAVRARSLQDKTITFSAYNK